MDSVLNKGKLDRINRIDWISHRLRRIENFFGQIADAWEDAPEKQIFAREHLNLSPLSGGLRFVSSFRKLTKINKANPENPARLGIA